MHGKSEVVAPMQPSFVFSFSQSELPTQNAGATSRGVHSSNVPAASTAQPALNTFIVVVLIKSSELTSKPLVENLTSPPSLTLRGCTTNETMSGAYSPSDETTPSVNRLV